jgi:hypothetical protein
MIVEASTPDGAPKAAAPEGDRSIGAVCGGIREAAGSRFEDLYIVMPLSCTDAVAVRHPFDAREAE